MAQAKKSGKKKPNVRKAAQAPGQHLGFSLQITRFLVKLTEADPGSTVSLEVFEDVGVETSGGVKTAEQNKSTSNGNPVSDRAVGLWKTLSNWVNAVVTGDLQLEKTFFEIYVSTKKSGNIVDSFSETTSAEDALEALKEAKNELWGRAPTYDRKAKVSDSIREFVNNVFEADESLVCGIIKNFELNCGSSSPQTDLKALWSKTFVPVDLVDKTLKYAEGWVKQETDLLLEKKEPASLSVDIFRETIESFIRKLDSRNMLASYANDPTPEEIQEDLNFKTYVRQLELIECDDGQKIEAVIDFLQASTNRTKWGAKGLVTRHSFDEFERALTRTWKNLKIKTGIEVSDKDDVTKGMHLYAQCSLHKAKLEGIEVPDNFTSGSFHAISNEKIIGWHPDYRHKLAASTNDKK